VVERVGLVGNFAVLPFTYFLRQRRYLIWRHIINAICQLKKVFPRKGADLVEQFKVPAVIELPKLVQNFR